ncbi:hypothetical protein V8O11_22295 [Erwinia aphidicola]|uniref:hypothetical protein n=1 Tax=Erwinia aphidicola TaxID=68334 RepID=UPI00300D2B37
MSQSLLEQLLSQLHLEMAQTMLADLRDPEKRSPQLYNAIIKFLKDNGIEIDPPKSQEQREAEANAQSSAGQIAALSRELPPVLADDEEFAQYH